MVRLSALSTGRLYPKKCSKYSFMLRGWVDPRIIVRPEASLLDNNKIVVVSHPHLLLLARSRSWRLFLCSQGRIRIWKGGALLTLQRFNKNPWRPLTAFLLKILDNVSSSGSGAGRAASSHRGSNLRGHKFSNLYDCFKHVFLTIPGIFGSPLVYIGQF